MSCPRWKDPTPLGWGDHVRWQHVVPDYHEQNPPLRLRPVGERHAEAIRGARRLRARAFNRVATGFEMFHNGAATIELEDGIPSYRFRRSHR